jgi:hypothetical protein
MDWVDTGAAREPCGDHLPVIGERMVFGPLDRARKSAGMKG